MLWKLLCIVVFWSMERGGDGSNQELLAWSLAMRNTQAYLSTICYHAFPIKLSCAWPHFFCEDKSDVKLHKSVANGTSEHDDNYPIILHICMHIENWHARTSFFAFQRDTSFEAPTMHWVFFWRHCLYWKHVKSFTMHTCCTCRDVCQKKPPWDNKPEAANGYLFAMHPQSQLCLVCMCSWCIMCVPFLPPMPVAIQATWFEPFWKDCADFFCVAAVDSHWA